ncbi:hypothetical protein B9Z39_11785 [Limnohabitans sp. JirII-29]|uniref:hypothetical protein n=1 Tax=unclassified Limnohabitans TaxID=2626134 RepID=UPI000C1F5E8B|nr:MULTISPECIES: hypothetical protein [unclassified Limnohabitans]PIT79156.1 hypothetical protein B9Z41_07000 [Limnohabitans sp. JirII-31]PUE25291.1 hypothetical protein B9Z39_11785 [Limnohabitans sp. JirII-29]
MVASVTTILLQALSTFVIAVFSTWLTIRLSQRKFRAERLWDRKAVAYERVIEAFHKAKRFSSENLDAVYEGREVLEERNIELRTLAKEAREEIRRAAEIGSFSLSELALKIVTNYEAELGDTKGIIMWHDYLDHDYAVTDRALKSFIAEAKRDLDQ